jgi:hypothetical protein
VSRIIRIVYHLGRLLLGGLFLYAGLVKAADITAFARDVANYQVLPYRWNYLVAATLPYVEFLAGLLLVANRRVRPAAFLVIHFTQVGDSGSKTSPQRSRRNTIKTEGFLCVLERAKRAGGEIDFAFAPSTLSTGA